MYLSWAEAARDLGVEPKEGSLPLFDAARSLAGASEGLCPGAAPLVLGLLCRIPGLTLAIHCHPPSNEEYNQVAAKSRWRRWAVELWGRRAFCRNRRYLTKKRLMPAARPSRVQ